MTNPTGAENARVQDADVKARELITEYLWMPGMKRSGLDSDIAIALREAEQRGMMRAAEIAREWSVAEEWIDRNTPEQIAHAIERAAAAPAKEK